MLALPSIRKLITPPLARDKCSRTPTRRASGGEVVWEGLCPGATGWGGANIIPSPSRMLHGCELNPDLVRPSEAFISGGVGGRSANDLKRSDATRVVNLLQPQLSRATATRHSVARPPARDRSFAFSDICPPPDIPPG